MTGCACGKRGCKIEINIDSEGHTLAFIDKCGDMTIMYLNKKIAREIIKKLAKI